MNDVTQANDDASLTFVHSLCTEPYKVILMFSFRKERLFALHYTFSRALVILKNITSIYEL